MIFKSWVTTNDLYSLGTGVKPKDKPWYYLYNIMPFCIGHIKTNTGCYSRIQDWRYTLIYTWVFKIYNLIWYDMIYLWIISNCSNGVIVSLDLIWNQGVRVAPFYVAKILQKSGVYPKLQGSLKLTVVWVVGLRRIYVWS